MATLEEMKHEMNVPVLIADQFGLIIYVNQAFTQTFGWENHEIIGQTISVVIPDKYHDAHHLSFCRFAVTETSSVLNHPLRLFAITKDGKEIESEHFITGEKIQGKWFFGARLRPIIHS